MTSLMFGLIALPTAAFAAGHPSVNTNNYTVSSESDVTSIAQLYAGVGKFTRQPGPWCADAVSVWLQQAGKPPLANRMAESALAYGPHVASPQRNDLVVMATRRGQYGHVGLVVADLGDRIVMISGNWSHRVSETVVPKRAMTFVRT